MMRITRKSPLTGRTTTWDLPVTPDQMIEFESPNRRRLVQDIFPDLTPAEREFIKSGCTESDWAAMFPPERDDEHDVETCENAADCEECAEERQNRYDAAADDKADERWEER